MGLALKWLGWTFAKAIFPVVTKHYTTIQPFSTLIFKGTYGKQQ